MKHYLIFLYVGTGIFLFALFSDFQFRLSFAGISGDGALQAAAETNINLRHYATDIGIYIAFVALVLGHALCRLSPASTTSSPFES